METGKRIAGGWCRLNTQENNGIHYFRKIAHSASGKTLLGNLETTPICGAEIKLMPFAELLVGHSAESEVNCPACQLVLKG